MAQSEAPLLDEDAEVVRPGSDEGESGESSKERCGRSLYPVSVKILRGRRGA